MIFGILKERFEDEQRVALTPFGVESLVAEGAGVVIETTAGAEARFPDDQYRAAGATVAYSADEVIGRADIVLKVMPPTTAEMELMREEQMLVSFLLLGMGTRDFVDTLLERRITALGYELLRSRDGSYPVMRLMSDISGQIASQIAGRFLRSDSGGRGVLLGGIPGVAPACVVILGAGTSGIAAAHSCIGRGAQVIMLDRDLDRLRAADEIFAKRITTVMATPENLRRGCRIADVFIGAISIDDDTSHHLISEDMVKTMKPGTVVIDISINQGGCIETSRPTTIKDPVFVHHGVIHYAVPNMPSMVARTATYALTNAVLPYLQLLQRHGGFDPERTTAPCIRCGVATHAGRGTHRILEDIYGIEVAPFECC
jgi:alanine dehydrogenase